MEIHVLISLPLKRSRKAQVDEIFVAELISIRNAVHVIRCTGAALYH